MKLRFSMRGARRTVVVAVILVSLATVGTGSSAPAQSGEPIVVGSTLSLTGAFAATGIIHKAAGETFIRWINANGGLLGRPVEWRVLDDESDPGQGHGALRAADQPGQGRPDHGAVRDAEHRRRAGRRRAPRLRAAEPHGGADLRPHLRLPVPDLVDRRASRTSRCRRRSSRRSRRSSKPPKRIAFVTNTGGSTNFISYGPPNSSEGGAVEGRRRPASTSSSTSSTRRPSPTGARSRRRCAPPTRTSSGTAAWPLDPANLIQAMEQLNYTAGAVLHALPGAGPAALRSAERADNVLSLTLFEPNGKLLKQLGKKAQNIVAQFARAGSRRTGSATASSTRRRPRRGRRGRRSSAGVRGARSVDNERVCSYLKPNAGEHDVRRRAQVQPGDEQLLAGRVTS